MVLIRFFGVVHDANTYYAEDLLKRLAAVDAQVQLEINILLEVDYLLRLDVLSRQGFPSLLHHKEPQLVIRDKEVLGDLPQVLALAREGNVEDVEVFNTVLYNRSARETSFEMMSVSGNPVAFLRFGAQDQRRPKDFDDLGVVEIELFANLCPRAVENFKRLVEGGPKFAYRDCPIHRLVKNGWFQTGDVVDGSGKNSVAVVDDSGVVYDESFSVDFGFVRGGIVGYANEGPHTNGSQFFVTLSPCPWMNNKFVGVGRVLQGFHVLESINNIPTSNQVPTRLVKITECGLRSVGHK